MVRPSGGFIGSAGRYCNMAVKFRLGPTGQIRVWIPPKPFGLGGSFLVSEDSLNSEGSDSSPGVLEVRAEGDSGGRLDNRLESETFLRGCRRTRFGLHARRCLKDAGAAMDRTCGAPEEAVFLTGTLPSVEVGAWAALAEYSAWVVHRLKAWVAKYCPGKLDFYCWEWQSRGALHLHYCCWIPEAEKRLQVLARFKSRWIGWLSQVGEMAGQDMFAGSDGVSNITRPEVIQAYAAPVVKSVGGYLSKYLGKGAEGEAPPGADFFYPSRWWGVSRPLRAVIDGLTIEGEISGSCPRDVAVYEDLISSARGWEIPVYQWKNRVGSGEAAALCFPRWETAVSWLEFSREEFVVKKTALSARERALEVVHETEKFFESVEVTIHGNPLPAESRTLDLIHEGLEWTGMVLNITPGQPVTALSTCLSEMLLIVGRLARVDSCRCPEHRVKPLRVRLQVARKALSPEVWAELRGWASENTLQLVE